MRRRRAKGIAGPLSLNSLNLRLAGFCLKYIFQLVEYCPGSPGDDRTCTGVIPHTVSYSAFTMSFFTKILSLCVLMCSNTFGTITKAQSDATSKVM